MTIAQNGNFAQHLLDILALSKDAAAIYTSENITIQFASDQMLNYWGKDRSIVGQNLIDAVPELKGQPFIGLLQEVWRSGQTYSAKDVAAELNVDGQSQTFYFDFEYRALLDEHGKTFSILHTATEVTERMKSWQLVKEKNEREQALNEELSSLNEEYITANEELASLNEEYRTLNEELEASGEEIKAAYDQLNVTYDLLSVTETKARLLLEIAPVAVGVIDADTFIIDTANDKLLELWNTNSISIGKSIKEVLPPLEAELLINLFGRLKVSGKPASGDNVEQLVSRNERIDTTFFNFIYQPITNKAGEVISVQIVANEVTAQRNAKLGVDLALAQLKLAKQATGMGVFDLDVVNDKLYWDERCRKIFGVDPQKAIGYGADFIKGLYPEDRDRTIQAVDFAYDQQSSGGKYDVEYRVVDASNGNICWVRAVGQVYFNEQAEPQRFIGTVLDITKTVDYRTKLEESEKRLQDFNEELTTLNEELNAVNEEYQAANEELVVTNEELQNLQTERYKLFAAMAIREARLELAADIVLLATIDIDLLTGEMVCSQRYAELFGFSSPDGLKREDFFNLIHPDDERDIVQPAMQRAYITGEFAYQVRMLIAGQPLKWIRVKGRLEYDADHQPVRIISTTTDVTEPVLARQKLEEAEERLRFATNAAQVGTWDLDIKNDLVIWDERCKELYGFSKDDIVSYDEVLRYIHPGDREQVHVAVQDALDIRSGGDYNIEFRTIGAEDSKLRWLHCQGKAFFDSDGHAYRFTGIAQDITENYLLQEDIEISKNNLEFAMDAANLGTWHLNVDTNELVANARLKLMFGFEADQPITLADCLERIAEEHRGLVADAIKQVITHGGDYDISHKIGAKDGSVARWVRAVGNVKVDPAGDITAFTGVLMDITEQKLDEQRRTDFIGMVSHELRNPLASMNGFVQVLALKAKKNDDPAMADIAGRAKRQVDKMSGLISGFLDVARMGEGKIRLNLSHFDMAVLIREVEAEVILTTTSHRFIFEPVEYTPVDADQEKIAQVVTNFLTNAAKYSPQNSTIHVACVTEGQHVFVRVKDEGMGIANANLPYVFDRFYRVESDQMKAVSGFGIGLYICKEIIERHGGKIGVNSKLGEGSTFWFVIALAK